VPNLVAGYLPIALAADSRSSPLKADIEIGERILLAASKLDVQPNSNRPLAKVGLAATNKDSPILPLRTFSLGQS
jgi:hypothetical protein